MKGFGARTVFFVRDAERALQFYTESLGFTLDWNYQQDGRALVVQVSLFGLQLILNETEPGAGGIDPEQVEPFRRHIAAKSIRTTVVHWGAPTLVIHDGDGNELFFWLPESERAGLETQLAGS